MTTKTITIKKRGGGTRKQKVMVLKSGKFRFIKNSNSSSPRKSSKKTSRKRSVKRVIRKTARRISMRRRTSRAPVRRKSGLLGSGTKGLLKTLMIGLGASATVRTVGGLVGQPQLANNAILPAGAAFLVGGMKAGAVALLLGGGLNALGGIFGGGQAQNGGGQVI